MSTNESRPEWNAFDLRVAMERDRSIKLFDMLGDVAKAATLESAKAIAARRMGYGPIEPMLRPVDVEQVYRNERGPGTYHHGYVAGMWAAADAGPKEVHAFVERRKAEGWTREEPGGGVVPPKSLGAVVATKGGEPPAVMTTDGFADTAESGWYRVRFMSGDDPADPDSWEPWHCVEVYAGDEYNRDEAGFIDGGQRVPFWIMKDSHRYQWGAPVVMPDDESLGSVVEPKGGGGADVPAPAVPMKGEPGPSVLLGAARASIPLPPEWEEFTDVPSGYRAANGMVGDRKAFAYRSRREIACCVPHRETGCDERVPIPLDIAAWLMDAQPVESTDAGS